MRACCIGGRLRAFFGGGEQSAESRHPAGLVALVGRPNVGKSTLLNRLIGEKLSITSRKAQTTRHRIMGVRTDDDAQYVFVDTPGFQTKHSSALNRSMNRGVTQALQEVDVICLVIEADRFGEQDRKVVALLPDDKPVILVINKIDLPSADVEGVKQQIEDVIGLDASEAVPISAKTGLNIDLVLEAIVQRLPPPKGDETAPLKALLVDSWYDAYLGVVVLVRVIDIDLERRRISLSLKQANDSADGIAGETEFGDRWQLDVDDLVVEFAGRLGCVTKLPQFQGGSRYDAGGTGWPSGRPFPMAARTDSSAKT